MTGLRLRFKESYVHTRLHSFRAYDVTAARPRNAVPAGCGIRD